MGRLKLDSYRISRVFGDALGFLDTSDSIQHMDPESLKRVIYSHIEEIVRLDSELKDASNIRGYLNRRSYRGGIRKKRREDKKRINIDLRQLRKNSSQDAEKCYQEANQRYTDYLTKRQ